MNSKQVFFVIFVESDHLFRIFAKYKNELFYLMI
jgi:hypothetical protein